MQILSFWGWESNRFADPRFANNGGGYSQPEGGALIQLKNGEIGIADFYDHDCGDFGRDAYFGVTLLDGREWRFVFGSNANTESNYPFDKVAPSFAAATGDDLGNVADTVIEAVHIAMEV